MESCSSPSIVPLGELECVREWFPPSSSPWEAQFACRIDREELVWVFTMLRGSSSPGYLDSIRQRLALLDSNVPSFAGMVTWEDDGTGGRLVSEVVSGEPMLGYLARRGSPSEWMSLSMILDLVGVLRRLAANGRVLSSFTIDDFFVTRRDGGRLEVVPVPVFAILREESPMSDFQLAKQWYEIIARMVIASKSGWAKGIARFNPAHARPLKKLFRDLSEGVERTLFERFDALDGVIRKLAEAPKVKQQMHQSLLAGDHPHHFLSETMMRGFEGELLENGLKSGMNPDGFSPHVFPATRAEGGEARSVYVVPPEGWFPRSHLSAVNRKMAHPFLKNHHNGVRAFSVVCGESRTCLVGEGRVGIPLPVLFSARGGLERLEVTMLAEKLHRALEQFEGADLPVELESPWQIELHPESESKRRSRFELPLVPLNKWPTWDLKLRVELPTEHFLGSKRTSSWRALRSRVGGSFYSVFLAWMLEWGRFDWAVRNGNQSGEPLSWDESLSEAFARGASTAEDRLQLIERVQRFSLV